MNDDLQRAYGTIWDAVRHTVEDTIGLWCDAVREGNDSELSKALKVVHEAWLERIASEMLYE